MFDLLNDWWWLLQRLRRSSRRGLPSAAWGWHSAPLQPVRMRMWWMKRADTPMDAAISDGCKVMTGNWLFVYWACSSLSLASGRKWPIFFFFCHVLDPFLDLPLRRFNYDSGFIKLVRSQLVNLLAEDVNTNFGPAGFVFYLPISSQWNSLSRPRDRCWAERKTVAWTGRMKSVQCQFCWLDFQSNEQFHLSIGARHRAMGRRLRFA